MTIEIDNHTKFNIHYTELCLITGQLHRQMADILEGGLTDSTYDAFSVLLEVVKTFDDLVDRFDNLFNGGAIELDQYIFETAMGIVPELGDHIYPFLEKTNLITLVGEGIEQGR